MPLTKDSELINYRYIDLFIYLCIQRPLVLLQTLEYALRAVVCLAQLDGKPLTTPSFAEQRN